MNLKEVLGFAYESLKANKLRAGLTVLGMVIGTSSIILVITVGLTGRKYILEQIQGVGSNLIYAYYEVGTSVASVRNPDDDINMGDLAAVQQLPDVAHAAGLITAHAQMSIEGRERDVTVIGATPQYFRVRNLRAVSGRFFDSSDSESFNKVCLVTIELARKLFGTLQVQGKSIKLFDVRFEIIGVFKEGVETFGTSEVSTYSALVPLSVLRYFRTSDKLDEIYASAGTNALVPSVTDQIRRTLESRHREGASYRVENLTEILQAARRIATALEIGLFLIGLISLIISGIGIMNIMLVTVTERTREIGVRMALGALRREILLQFLAESMILSTFGGITGILVGISGPLFAAWFGFEVPISRISVALAFFLSMTVGIIFGLIPANRASKLNPTEALRYE
jgi:putative ABC transport system permease protein